MKSLLSRKGSSALHMLFSIGLIIGVLCAVVSYMRKHNDKSEWKIPTPSGSSSATSSGWKLPGLSPGGSGQTNSSGVSLRNVPIEKQGDLYYFDYRDWSGKK